MSKIIKGQLNLAFRQYSTTYTLAKKTARAFSSIDLRYANEGYLPVGFTQLKTGNKNISICGMDLRDFSSPEIINVRNSTGSSVSSNTTCSVSGIFAPSEFVDTGDNDVIDPIFKWVTCSAFYNRLDSNDYKIFYDAPNSDDYDYFSYIAKPSGYDFFGIVNMYSGNENIHICSCYPRFESEPSAVMAILNQTGSSIGGTLIAQITLCYIKSEYVMTKYYNVTEHGQIPSGMNPYHINPTTNLTRSDYIPKENVTGAFIYRAEARQVTTGDTIMAILDNWEIRNLDTSEIILSSNTGEVTDFSFIMPKANVSIIANYRAE